MILLAFFLVITPIVIVHELGHMWAAKANGIPTIKFCVGFGKKLWGFSYRGTEYRWNLLPFGAYVQFYEVHEHDRFYTYSKWVRFQTLIMGPLANFVFAWFMFFILALIQGSEFWHAFPRAFEILGTAMVLLMNAMLNLFTGQIPMSELSGPVGTAEIAGQLITQGWDKICILMAVISLNLGAFNLLPIPGLDGGHLAVIGIETVSGRELSLRAKTVLQMISAILLLGLTVYILIGDVLEWVFR